MSVYKKQENHFGKTFITLFQYPNSVCKWYARDKFMVCEIKIKSIYSETPYAICINYEKWYAPRVWIVEPDFSSTQYLPHVYASDANMLCLYHPDNFSWTQDKDIKQTIIFWALSWIEFYEVWKATGLWVGSEAEHIRPKKNPKPEKSGKAGISKPHMPIRIRDIK